MAMSTSMIPYLQTLSTHVKSIQDILWILQNDNKVPKGIIGELQADIGYLSMHIGELKAWHKVSTS